MVSIHINIIQHEKCYLIVLLISLKAATLLKSADVFCEFSEISRNNFFIEHIWATAFGLSFVNPRKKSEGTSLVKFLQSCHFNIK